jgi:cation transport ATPase
MNTRLLERHHSTMSPLGMTARLFRWVHALEKLVSLALDAYATHVGDPLALVVIVLGATPLVRGTIRAVRERRYAPDNLALLAITAALAAIEFLVGAAITLMLASGQALEEYAVRRARRSLGLLTTAFTALRWLWTKRADITDSRTASLAFVLPLPLGQGMG